MNNYEWAVNDTKANAAHAHVKKANALNNVHGEPHEADVKAEYIKRGGLVRSEAEIAVAPKKKAKK